MRVACLFVCESSVFVCIGLRPRAYLRNGRVYYTTSNRHQIYVYRVGLCYLWPWLGRPLTALRYVMYFRFHG